MKKVFAILAMAASLAACARMEQPVNETLEGTETATTYTLSIKATKGLDTRALELNGNILNAIWDGTEQVYVFRNGGSGHIAILTPDQHAHPDKASCQLEGTFIELPGAGDVLTLKLNGNTYTDQGGTLAFIGGHNDYAVATLTVTGIEGGEIQSKEGGANFVSQQAIVKFTLKDKAGTSISPTAFTVMDGDNEVASVTPVTNTYPTNGNGILYVAVPAVSDGGLTLTATVGDYNYTYAKAGVTFTAGKYYSIAVKMNRIVDLSKAGIYESGTFTAMDGDILTNTFPDANRQVRIADGATVTLRDVNIANSSYAGIGLAGGATITLEGTNTVKGGSNYAGIHVPSGSTLIMEGEGSLTVSGGSYAAGIGAGMGNSCGNIVIESGSLSVYGGNSAAGIGGGYNSGSCGNISIKDGSVHVTGGNYAAGIGGGATYSGCGDITISGGNVEVSGGLFAAGIGGGYQFSPCGDIAISGGTVEVSGGLYAAGIGGGYQYSSYDSIAISDPARVKATKGSSASRSIGPCLSDSGGNVTIYGTVYWDESQSIRNDTYLGGSPLTIGY